MSPLQSPGSIVVDHEIFFTMTEGSNTPEDLEEIMTDLVDKLRETEATQGDCQQNTCGWPWCPRPPVPR